MKTKKLKLLVAAGIVAVWTLLVMIECVEPGPLINTFKAVMLWVGLPAL